MRFLHTADWHVGKTLKGRCRLDEQERVLREVVGVARERQVDAVLVAGDLYDTAAPSAQAQRLVVRTLMGLASTGRRWSRSRATTTTLRRWTPTGRGRGRRG